MTELRKRTVGYQFVVFTIQWMLMIIGFGLLSTVIAPNRLFNPALPNAGVLDAAIKASIALLLSVLWLFLWDKQVRTFFYRKMR